MVLAPAAELAVAARAVRARGPAPSVGIVLGSGLGDFASQLIDAVAIPYREIPGMFESRVGGHASKLWLGKLGPHVVACLQGRVHTYEGHELDTVCFGVSLLAELGCRRVILTNAAGGIDATFLPGDLMLITDHINLSGRNPLVGPHDGRGARFVDLTEAYDLELRELALQAAAAHSLVLRQGVYAGVLGPSYETPAEVRMLARLGASAVGMSTVLEVIALRYLGVRVAALSCITNAAAGLSATPLTHEEVQETAARVRVSFQDLLRTWVLSLP